MPIPPVDLHGYSVLGFNLPLSGYKCCGLSCCFHYQDTWLNAGEGHTFNDAVWIYPHKRNAVLWIRQPIKNQACVPVTLVADCSV
jgi:hypothetical protein